MKKMFCCFSFVSLASLLLVTGLHAYPIMQFSLYNTEGMVDQDGNLLPEFARVEFIWAGADGQIDDVIGNVASPDFLRPSGDDQIVKDAFLSEIVFGVGESLVKGSIPDEEYYGHIDYFIDMRADMYTAHGVDPTKPWDDKFYIRFFTATDPQQSFFDFGYVGYGESELFELPDTPWDFTGTLYDDFDFAPAQSPVITNVVPEPATVLLGLVSLVALYGRKRK